MIGLALLLLAGVYIYTVFREVRRDFDNKWDKIYSEHAEAFLGSGKGRWPKA